MKAGHDEADGRPRGRPRNPGADEAIMDATVEVISECGFARFSVEAVAARAGVGKATIYRRWPTKEKLLVAAAERVVTTDDLPDTGVLHDDLTEWFWGHFRGKKTIDEGRRLGQVIVEASANPEMMAIVRQFRRERRNAVSLMVERAHARGECGPLDADVLIDLVFGALLQRSLFGDSRAQKADIDRYVTTVLTGLDPGMAARRGG